MKKVLLTSAVALAAFGAVQSVSATSADSFGNYNTDGTPKVNATGQKDNPNNRFGYAFGLKKYPYLMYARDEAHGFTKRARITVVDGGGKPVQGATIDIQIIPGGTNIYGQGTATTRAAESKQYEVFTVKTDVNGDADFSVNDYYTYGGKMVKEAVDASGKKLGYAATKDTNQLVDPAKGYVAGNYVQEPVTTDNESEALLASGSVMFKEGEILKYRVAKTASNHKEATTVEGKLVIGKDMYSNDTIKLPYKDDSRSVQVGNSASSTTAAQYGWAQTAEGWKYFENSAAVTGWKQVDGNWYYLNDKGVMQTGWVNVNGTWYFLNKSGAMQTGWLKDGDTWYFLESTGAMKASQWFEVAGKWYHVNGSGALSVNTTVDGYNVNANGEWV